METTIAPAALDALSGRRHEHPWLALVKNMVRIKLAVFGFVVIFIFVIFALFSPLIAPYDPTDTAAGEPHAAPSMAHWMGVDQLGRDVMSRIIFGSRIALGVSVCAVGLGAALGVPIGLSAAYFRGWTDSILMRFMDAIISFPGLILAMGLAAMLGAEWYNLVIAIGVGNIPWIARVVRSQALAVSENEYILAARTIGAKSPRILARYIWPNSTAPVIVQTSVGMAWAVLVEAGLSFLGVGVRPPTPTWGSMLQFAFPVLKREPWLSIAPGTAIFLLVLAFNFVGDALRDVLDPRLKGVTH